MMQKLICVGSEYGFTIGKEYSIIEWLDTCYNKEKILIENDFGDVVTHKLNEFVITMSSPSDIWVEYTDESKDGLTNGKYYNLLDRGKASLQDEFYYFLDDDNKFIGAWRGRRFKDVTKLKSRNDKLNNILSEH